MYRLVPCLKATLAACALVAAASGPSGAAERRCGWIDNPTPANWTLVDRDGAWTLGAQGGHQAEGMDLIPDLSGKQFVETNGSYGYACGCLDVDVDAADRRVTRIAAVAQKPLSACRKDPKLPKQP